MSGTSGNGPYLVKEASWVASVGLPGSAGWSQVMEKGPVDLLALCINFNLTSVLFIYLLAYNLSKTLTWGGSLLVKQL